MAAYLIDGIVIYIVSFIIGFKIEVVLSMLELIQVTHLRSIVESGMFGIRSNIFSIITTWLYFAKILSYMTCFIGYFMILFTEKKQALHDIIAGTLVIKQS